MKKILINMQFGRQWDWTEQYIDNCNTLEKYGWDWLFITDENIQSKGNFRIVPMQLHEFADLIKDKFGVRPNYYLNSDNEVSFHGSAYLPMFGYLFSEHLKGYDFWGHTNLDLVYGRLDRFFPDEFFEFDVFGNDPDAMNGIFSLFRNIDKVNKLFMEVPNWDKLALSDKGHYAFDEKEMTQAVRKAHAEGRIKFKSGHYAGSERQGEVARMRDDGTLFNKIDGKEMAMYHFSVSKRYPDYLKKEEWAFYEI